MVIQDFPANWRWEEEQLIFHFQNVSHVSVNILYVVENHSK